MMGTIFFHLPIQISAQHWAQTVESQTSWRLMPK